MSSYLTPLSRILVLTNDSLGSTYFQRVLSLYLNIYFSPTINLHDIVNHYNGNFKNLLVSLLSYQDSLVCRASQYRLSEIRENPKNIYKILNLFFNRIFCIKRNSFETALSLSIVEHFNHPLNVYETDQFEEVFSSPEVLYLYLLSKINWIILSYT